MPLQALFNEFKAFLYIMTISQAQQLRVTFEVSFSFFFSWRLVGKMGPSSFKLLNGEADFHLKATWKNGGFRKVEQIPTRQRCLIVMAMPGPVTAFYVECKAVSPRGKWVFRYSLFRQFVAISKPQIILSAFVDCSFWRLGIIPIRKHRAATYSSYV